MLRTAPVSLKRCRRVHTHFENHGEPNGSAKLGSNYEKLRNKSFDQVSKSVPGR